MGTLEIIYKEQKNAKSRNKTSHNHSKQHLLLLILCFYFLPTILLCIFLCNAEILEYMQYSVLPFSLTSSDHLELYKHF
jgi:hypothetical protein